jgi:predicted nucleotidyltransferase
MNKDVQTILVSYIEQVKKIYGNHLEKIILYGSYARGDATSSSDIDIMILVDLDDLEIKKYADELSDMTYDMNLDYDVMIMPIVKNEKHFNYWLEAYPFYNNVSKEGVSLFAVA